MSQERADLNWYHNPPDYFATRTEQAAVQSAQHLPGEGEHSTRDGPSHETAAGEFTFDDVLDIINPLHHLPVISSLYRELTGDQISAHARIIGGGLFGGGAGFVAAITNAISEEATGRDLGENLAAAVFGDETAPSEALAERQLVSSAPAPDGSAPPTPRPAPRIAPGVSDAAPALQGQAALDALFADLSDGTPTTAPPLPSNRPPTELAEARPGGIEMIVTADGPPPQAPTAGDLPAAPPPPRVVTGGAGQIAPDPTLFIDPGTATSASGHKHEPEHGFTDQMLDGLKKYRDLMTRRQVSFAYDDRTPSPGH